VFKRLTLTFHSFQRVVQIHLKIYPIKRRSERTRESTAAIVALVVETTRRPGPTLLWPWRNFLHQASIAGLKKHLSPCTGHISDWMAFALRPFTVRKQNAAHYGYF